MQSYPVELLQAMLERYTPSGSEAQLANLLKNEMQANGFESRIDDTGNVVGVLGSEGPRILLCGHMDTVPGLIPVRKDGDLLYGRGAVDAKAPLAAMIVGATLAKKRCKVPAQITVVGVVEEETSSRGIRGFMINRPRYDLSIFGEPSGASNIIVGYKGSLRLHLSFQTAGGHSASPWLYDSCYEESRSFWDAFQNQLLDNKAESKFETVTGCVTSSNAGGPGNNVPATATLEIDTRIPPSIRSNDFIAKIEKFIEDYTAEREVKIELRVDDQSEAFVGSTDSQAVSSFRWAIKQVLGAQAAFLKKTGTGDVNLFTETQKIPMFAYGPGDSSLDHTEAEHVEISEYLASIEVYAQALPRFAERFQKPELPPTTL